MSNWVIAADSRRRPKQQRWAPSARRRHCEDARVVSFDRAEIRAAYRPLFLQLSRASKPSERPDGMAVHSTSTTAPLRRCSSSSPRRLSLADAGKQKRIGITRKELAEARRKNKPFFNGRFSAACGDGGRCLHRMKRVLISFMAVPGSSVLTAGVRICKGELGLSVATVSGA